MDRATREGSAKYVETLMLAGSKRVEPSEPMCKRCNDMGMRVTQLAGGQSYQAQPCECRTVRTEERDERILRRSGIPERYLNCTLENYETSFKGADASLASAAFRARGFVKHYPPRVQGIGLLFYGTVGTGKTHLAVGILRALVLEKGVRALFCDHRGLLKAVNNSYNPKVSTTELEVLQPVFDAEVLVIDELGSAKKTEWVSDMVEHILNTRYNDHRTTIITTNYPNLAAGKRAEAEPEAQQESRSSAFEAADSSLCATTLTREDLLRNDLNRRAAGGFADTQVDPALNPFGGKRRSVAPAAPLASDNMAKRVNTAETLSDRIGERMRSRLAEMCVTVEMKGKDYRTGAKKASF